MTGLEPDDRAYRRGLVLGWSLAEVFLLIVFALLFAFAGLATKLPANPTTPPLQTTPRGVPPNTTSPGMPPRPIPNPPGRTGHPPDSFDDLFHKLTLCEKNNASLSAQLDKCHAENEKLKRENEALKRLIAKLPSGDKNPQPTKANNQPGGGADYPSCFKDAAGRTDYIFDVTLGSTGIIVHKNDLPLHAAEEAQLPLGQIGYDQELSDDSFLAETDGLFTYSEGHVCRFVVRICDQTKGYEKDVYIERLQVVEEHFYKHLGCAAPASGDR